MLTVGFSWMPFISLRKFCTVPSLLNIKGSWILAHAFSLLGWSYRFCLFYQCGLLHWLVIAHWPALLLWDMSCRFVVYNPLFLCSGLGLLVFCWVLLYLFSQRCWSIVFLKCLWFGLVVSSTCFSFLFLVIGGNFSLKYLKPSGLGLSFLESLSFLIQSLYFTLQIYLCFKFFLHWF